MPHFFYLARCRDGSLYAGTCVDIKAREATHNEGKGAKYTRSRRPIAIIYHEEFETLSEARRREMKVKGMSKKEKERMVENG
jgi:putative endonuclease